MCIRDRREIGGRLLERLELIDLKPTVILDLGCGTGATTALLLKKYRRAQVIGLDLAPALVAAARKRAPWLHSLHGVVGEPDWLPLASASCDLIFSNLLLQWCGAVSYTHLDVYKRQPTTSGAC